MTGRQLFFAAILALTIGALPSEPVPAQGISAGCTSSDDLLRLQAAATETVVTVHTSPAHTHPVAGELPYDATAIRCVGPCRDGWCRIRWHGIVGWVPVRNLSR